MSLKRRRNIVQRSAAAAQSLDRDPLEEGCDEDTGSKDIWAEGTANTLCLPLKDFHDTLLKDWKCRCGDALKHSHVLASFATPCHNDDMTARCILRFTASHQKQLPWVTVHLEIADRKTVRLKSGLLDCAEVLAPETVPALSLHDSLMQITKSCRANAVLNFSPNGNSWSIEPAVADSHQRYTMVSLASLTADSAIHPLREEPYDRRVSVALIMAYAFLQLGNSPWFPYDMDDINVWFYQAQDSAPVLLQPFLDVCLDARKNPKSGLSHKYAVYRLINPRMCCLPALGRLMLVLITGISIDLVQIEQFMVGYKKQYPERAPYVWAAIKPCITGGMFTSTSETIHDNENLRTKFLQEVIHRLHMLLSQSKSSLESEIAKLPSHSATPLIVTQKQQLSASVSTVAAKEHSTFSPGPSSGHAIAPNHSHPILTYCLHDNGSRSSSDHYQ